MHIHHAQACGNDRKVLGSLRHQYNFGAYNKTSLVCEVPSRRKLQIAFAQRGEATILPAEGIEAEPRHATDNFGHD